MGLFAGWTVNEPSEQRGGWDMNEVKLEQLLRQFFLKISAMAISHVKRFFLPMSGRQACLPRKRTGS